MMAARQSRSDRAVSPDRGGEALRDDAQFSYVAAWEWTGDHRAPALHPEPLRFENIALAQRSYQ
jgi:succinate dehydrogenase / fumarate reductase, flavoprotein subunit